MTVGGGAGFAASLAHPGGNVTGNDVFRPEIVGKRLELLKQVLPSLRRAGLISLKGVTSTRLALDLSDAARTIDVELQPFEVSDSASYEDEFAKASVAGVSALVMQDSGQLLGDAAILASLANKHRLPTVGAPVYATRGGLFGCGANYLELFRRAAILVDKILEGAKPGDIRSNGRRGSSPSST